MSGSDRIVGRLAERPYKPGDELPATGSMTLISGPHNDVDSDQHRAYGWRLVLGYSAEGEFVCLQTPGCWPTVERLRNCWIAKIRVSQADVRESLAKTAGAQP